VLKALGIASESYLPANAKFEHGDDDRLRGIVGDSRGDHTGLITRRAIPRVAGTTSAMREHCRFCASSIVSITGVFDPGGHNLAPRNTTAIRRLCAHDQLSRCGIAYHLRDRWRPVATSSPLLQPLRALLQNGDVGPTHAPLQRIGEPAYLCMYNNDTPH